MRRKTESQGRKVVDNLKVQTVSNCCVRCGRERIYSKSWEETTIAENQTTITYTEMVCPDPECQKVVDEEWAVKKKEKETFAQNKRLARAGFYKRTSTSENKVTKQT